MKLYEALSTQLKKEPNYVTDNGELKKWVVINKAQNYDAELIEYLLDEPTLKEKFFLQVAGVLCFNQSLFIQFLEQKNYLNDSYTQYKNKVGLNIDGKYLKQRNEVALVWPFKDCVLECGQSREEDKREEIFFNETLAQDEITQLLEPKVLTNAKHYTADGEKPLDQFNRNVKGVITDNLIIKGNNLLALHSLKEEFAGKVKLIYIDPPYNTGKDGFQYNDSFNHSSWLTFMKNRLEVAKELLSKDGSIWMNIDDREAHYLKVLGDDIFGRDNFIANIVWEKKYAASNDTKGIADFHDHILVFSKSIDFKRNLLPRTEKQNKIYRNDDFDGKGLWRSDNLLVRSFSEEYVFPIINPNTGIEYMPKKGSCWRANKETIRLWLNENRIFFGKDGNGAPQLKRYLNEVQQGIVPGTMWKFDEVGHNDAAKKEIEAIFGEKAFITPKPERLLQRIISIGSNENDIVLDFFAGSGTTAAVALKMKRQFITTEQMDYIENVTIKRLKKVIGKNISFPNKEVKQEEFRFVAEPNSNYSKLEFDEGGISKAVNWQGGGEFVYLELKKYNQTFIEQIEAAQTDKEILKIWEAMKEKSFLNYNVYLQKQEQHIEEFKALPMAAQKQHLVSILDKNQLYVNRSSLNDKDFAVTEQEKKVTKDFYQMKK